MSNKKEYWQWKSTIIDFDTISEEKADFGDYITKKEMIFQYLGTPDKEIHEWYNGGYSCEYNYALKYAKELGLVEEYIDYEDKLYEKEEEIAQLNKIIEEMEKIFDSPYFDKEVSKQLGSDGFFTFKQMYEACNIVFKKKLQELKEEGK